MIDNLKDLKDTYESVRTQIDKGKEPIEEMVLLLNFLKAIAGDSSLLHEKVDKDYRRFFYDDFTNGLIKRITREKSRDDKYLEILTSVLEAFLLVLISELKNGHYNQQFFDSAKFIFDYDNILHNQNYQIPEEQLKAIRSTSQQWRKELKVGDLVDAIQDETTRCSGWSQARISQLSGDLLHLEFIHDQKSADRYLDRWSVEIAEYESKTKDLFAWKTTLLVDAVIDAHDKSVWNKSTILEIKEETVQPDRIIKKAFVAFRIYFEKGPKIDEKGRHYDGWSNRFDEWIPLYSPRIQPFYTKTQKGMSEDFDIDEDLDNLFQPENGYSRVFAVPRLRKCISSCYVHLINFFGQMGGFDQIIETLSKLTGQDDESLDLNFISILMECVSRPYLIYHSEFQKEFCPKITQLAKNKLKDAPEKSLRDVKRERIETIIKSIDSLQRRNLSKEFREKETESLKLDVCLMCLKSNYLERRIQSIRDLNQIIRNNRMMSTKSITNEQIIEWLQTNDVFSILFNAKKTHLQIVQRCSEILKLLLSEDKLSAELLEMFWTLSKSDYKFEVYKIINETSFQLKQDHINYIFEQVRQIPPEKLAMEEFQCLSELGKYAKNDQFRVDVSNFFWNIICNSDNYKDDLVTNCITRFCEMVKNWDITKKHQFFIKLVDNLDQNRSSLPSLRLFKGLIKDQKDKGYYYNYNSSSNYNYSPTKTVQTYPQQSQGEADPTTITTTTSTTQVQQQELTLSQSIEQLLNEHNLVSILLSNLKSYCESVNSKTTQVPTENRKKLNILNPKHSHHDEIDERLQFLKYIASISEFKISKLELGVIYDLLVKNSKIPSDQEEFLTWCKSSCEQSSVSTVILDLNEVGEFFTEKMKSKELDVKNLLVVGFDFLQHYFLSVNEKEQNLLKSAQPQKQKVNTSSTYYTSLYSVGYGPALPKNNYGNNNYTNKNQQVEEDEIKTPVFKLVKPPKDLDQLDIVWNMALECENDKVVPKAIDFLIKVYYSLDEDLSNQRIQVQNELIAKCMDILKRANDEFTIKRAIEIIKHVIYEAEKKGTGDVQPHNAVLKGELLEKVTIKNRASPTKNNITMAIYSNTTVWEFRKEVAKQLDLAPKYLKLERQNQKVIKDIDNGKTLAQLGFSNNEQISAYKVYVEEEVASAPLIGSDNKLTEKAKAIFNEWFDMYSNENGQMTKETCGLFVKGCTGEQPGVNDERILNLFKAYDNNNDGLIEREDFMIFYESSSRGKAETVRENLKAHNIRNDLKKLSEIQEDSSFTYEHMPRYKISKQQEYFDLLIGILDRHDSSAQDSWDLIQMLATNQVLYTRVLELKTATDPNTQKIDWNKFFDSQSVYKLLYTLQIIEAVMEEGEGSDLERITIIEDKEVSKKKVPVPPPLLPGMAGIQAQNQQKELPQIEQVPSKKEDEQQLQPAKFKKSTSIVEDESIDKKLRKDWTSMFLNYQGFQYILNVFMEKDIQTDQNGSSFNQIFELKHVAFLLKLLRIFIMAAFSTSKESSVYETANLIRRSSSIQDDDIKGATETQQNEISEGSTFKELQKLLQGPMGEEIIESINYKQLQNKILKTIEQILSKQDLIYEDKLIIENALSLWVGCVLHHNELFNEFYDFKGIDGSKIQNCNDFILTGLLFCSYEKVREEFKQTLIQLSHNLIDGGQVKSTPLFFLLKLLSENFSLITSYHCKQYFELFCELIDYYFMSKSLRNDESQQVFDPEQLLAIIIDKIQEFNKMSQEQAQEGLISIEQDGENITSENENIYIGLIQLTGKIIDNFDISFSEKIVEQKSLIDEIFVRFLFASVFKETSKSSSSIKIKAKQLQRNQGKKQTFGKKSKDAAYRLLNSLIRKSPLLMSSFLEKSMVPLIKLIRRIDGWNYSPPGSTERQQKYVGLRNLGCICYMNSMLQQFFMIPAFRYNLLSVDDKIPEMLVEYKGHQVDDNVLHQLQKLMAHLELSERQDYNPFEFCFSFKELDGNPTNIGEQKDAQEFLNLSFDRIENLLKPTSRKYLLQSVFGGQTCSQLLCQECGKVKNRVEDFYNLSLPVKDIKSMQESLQKLIEGEVISDYQCDNCNKKVDVSKRTLISQTPNVLIVHLQRILFNFDTFKNDKINSFWEFPFSLDLKPYSFYEVMKKENRLKKPKQGDDEEQEEQKPEDQDTQWPEEEDCFEYKLVGANIHSGSANAGHYWSYINTMRGFLEPNENDENWNKTESDKWMEYNDSQVRDFNFEKLKDECYGGDKNSAGEDSGWSFGGSYGKSAYMLVYERRKKKPLKILVPESEVEESKMRNEIILFDEKKQENFKLIDYREGVEDLQPNQIYKQVFEDNLKFEFENDIYSTEFFEFVKGILSAVISLDKDNGQNVEIMCKVKQNALTVGKKAILDILTKCFYNQGIKQMVDVMIDIFKSDSNLCAQFMEQCWKDDRFDYLFVLLLECPDNVSRSNISVLLKYVLNALKIKEKDYLYEIQTIETQNDKGETFREDQYVALSSRFIIKSFNLLNSYVAKNWSRFDNFLEVLYGFAVGDKENVTLDDEQKKIQLESERVGLTFFFKHKFIEKACDFLLGRKSPLCKIGDKRIDMGGTYQTPNFSGMIKIVTIMIQEEQLLVEFPLSDLEKKMFLQHDLLKVMLGSSQGSKQFGKCLANMCRDNLKLSKKVAKVFIKSINNSNYENVRNYLAALKPFLLMPDQFKHLKLEWVFGFHQINCRKGFREERFKYGLELVDKINDDAGVYVTPLASAPIDDALLSQLLKCKGRLDTFAINCLKEMLSLMAKDDEIARFVFYTAPHTYQYARYSDWIRPYLEHQKSELEKGNSYTYFKNKHETLIKSLTLLSKYEERCDKFREEDFQAMEKLKADGILANISEDWLAYQNSDVYKHFPPQLIIGKQIGDEKEFLVYDENPLVKVTITEISCEYNYSNPTGHFNVSLPHIEFRTGNYQTLSYMQYKRSLIQNERTQQYREDEENNNEASEQDPQEETKPIPEVKEPIIQVVNWFERCKQGPILLKVVVTSKQKQKVSVKVTFESDSKNIRIPISFMKEQLVMENEQKCLIHLQKIDPLQDWGNLKLKVDASEKNPAPNPPPLMINSYPGTGIGVSTGIQVSEGIGMTFIPCSSCGKLNDTDSISCIQCSNDLSNFVGPQQQEKYFD